MNMPIMEHYHVENVVRFDTNSKINLTLFLQ